MEQQLNSSTGGWIGDDRRDEADFTSVSQTIAKPNVSCRLYSLVDRLQKHSEWKYPERKWGHQFYYNCAFEWMGKENELEQRVLKFEKDMQSANGS